MTASVPASGQDKRKDARYGAEIAVTLHRGQRQLLGFTSDVSFGGMFLRLREEVALGSLVKLEIELDPATPRIFHAMVVHSAKEPGGGVTGYGLRFYGVGRDDQTRWNRWVHSVRSARDAAAPEDDGSVEIALDFDDLELLDD